MSHLQTHHRFWPRRTYKTMLEKRFRNLPCNLDHLTAEDHRAIHARYPAGNPGGKPSQDAMRQAIVNHVTGRCGCHDSEPQAA